MSAFDVNKRVLQKCGCLEIMKAILEGDDHDELPYAIGITTQLAFDEANASWIEQEMRQLIVGKLCTHEDAKIQALSEKLRWLLEEQTGGEAGAADLTV